ncbi:multiple sugar transport system substrate-binding protein [Caldanaerobius fijiensis DSM 17918]|uniref:Multiple sugar transport system substrate-binding protein n=1 Tax=Caldanaerobius fijiensis DSM 17918 TaxID=1121256 RepID=A0A1M4WKV9_9THEO|nr:ABC transporter substrate-binding protein [Caldanaerobius fijiensis]SHE81845.1 multiple sugar transport system substrate-binding protein [Caldanaerobius fijiensis DSM 17918]
MSNVRRLFSIIMIIAMIGALLLSGCGNKDTKHTTPSSEKNKGSQSVSQKSKNANANGVTEVTFWQPDWGADQMAALKKAVDSFNKTHKNIRVRLVILPWSDGNFTGFDTKLISAIAGNNPPDIVNGERSCVPEWAAKALLEDISDLVKRDGINANDYYQGPWEACIYNGKQYAMPLQSDTRALLYNKTLFKKAGLDPNSPPKTIDELDQMAEKLTIKDANGNYTQLGYVPWWGQGSHWVSVTYLFGGKMVNSNGNITPNDPNIVKSLQWIVGYAQKYGYDKVNQMANQLKLNTDPFYAGRVAMRYSGSYEIPNLIKPDNNISFEWDFAPLPTTGVGDYSPAWGGGAAVAIPKGAKHRDAAWEFIKFITGKEGQEMLMSSTLSILGDLSPLPSVNKEFENKLDPHYKKLIDDIFPKTNPVPATPVTGTLAGFMGEAINNALQGKGDPKALLDDVKKKIDAELAKPIYER